MNDQPYISMYGNICDRIVITNADAQLLRRWLDRNGLKLNKQTREALQDVIGPFLSTVAVTQVTVDAGAGTVAMLRIALEWARS